MKIQGLKLPQHIYEQYLWRIGKVALNSPQCWMLGSCKVCGCSLLDKLMEDRGCSISEHPELLKKREPCYPDMMKEQQWKEYKSKHNIKLFE